MMDFTSILTDPALTARIRAVRLIAFDFDGVFTDNMVYVLQDGTEAVRCYRGDGLGLAKLSCLGIEAMIVSTEPNPVVTARSSKLKIPCLQGVADKRAALDAIAREKNLTLEQIAFVGNDINDRACLQAVGLPIVVQDAHSDVIPLARYRTRSRGGEGAVREVCDLFEQVLTHDAKLV
jgi:YrbI family 3-deoxy-D-manno-octulosonate 8-phosphate phosphatase